MVWSAGTNSLWMMYFLFKKAINSVWSWIFANDSLLAAGKSVNTTPSIAVLIPDRTGSTRSRLPWRCFPEAMDPGHTWKWSLQKLTYVSLSARLWVCAIQIGSTSSAYPNHRGRWWAPANAQFLRNQCQSPILCQHLSNFLHHFWGSVCRWPTRTWLIISRFLPFGKAFEPFVNPFSAHGFPLVHLHLRFTLLGVFNL